MYELVSANKFYLLLQMMWEGLASMSSSRIAAQMCVLPFTAHWHIMHRCIMDWYHMQIEGPQYVTIHPNRHGVSCSA